MHLDSRIKALLGAASAIGALVALTAGGSASAATKSAGTPGCTVANNIEAIIDDSGSMAVTDSSKFRASLLEILAGLPGNAGKQMGAVEFGDLASQLFAPLAIGTPAAQASVTAALGAIDANGSGQQNDFAGTNYDAGFNLANQVNKTADARIFLSDGEPNFGGYTQGTHLNPATKTYVVGFGGVGSSSTELNQIVSDTHGQLFALNDSSQVQSVAGDITAALNCKTPPITKTAVLSQGQGKAYGFAAASKTADILVTWPTNTATIVANIVSGGGGKASVSKVRVQRQNGSTFTSLHVRGLKRKQKVKVRIKATKAAGPTTVTTQIIR